MDSKERGDLALLMAEQIKATNRVNHAVRALVLPSTIMIVAVLVSTPFILLGVFAVEPGMVIFGALFLLAGAIGAILAQLRETKLSTPPQEIYQPSPTPRVRNLASEARPRVSNLEGWSRLDESQPAPKASNRRGAQKECASCGKPFAKGRLECPACGFPA